MALVSVAVRPYEPGSDYELVAQFLVELYEPGRALRNWLRPRWEYMHHHPLIANVDLTAIGLAVDGDRLVGVVHPEDTPAFCYLQAGRDDVKPLLVEWAETHLGGWSRSLEREALGCYVDDTDTALREVLAARGYAQTRWGEHSARLPLLPSLPYRALPDGYRLQSLADENDLERINRVLWRGFNHPGPAPDDEIPGRVLGQSAPHFRKDLTIVAVAPDGAYASYAGMWFVPENNVAYVEPVATDPDHRRRGLGSAAVLESLRRVRSLGADVAWVGSDQAFYTAMGFEVVAHSTLWVRGGE